MQYAQLWHAIVGFVLMAIIIAHIYIGTIGMEGAFDAMGNGQVEEQWASRASLDLGRRARSAERARSRPRARRRPNACARLLAGWPCAVLARSGGSYQTLDGHGGPVMDIAVAPDGPDRDRELRQFRGALD